MVSLRNVDVRDASVETGFGDRAVFAARSIRKKNSGKQRKTAGRFAVIADVEPVSTQDFRRERDLPRCKFAARTAKTAKGSLTCRQP